MNTLPARFARLFALAALLLLAGCAYGNHIKRGDAHFEQGQLEQALQAYQSARKIDPDAPEANAKIAQTQRLLADNYCADGQALLDANDLFSAIDATSKAYEFRAQNPCVDALVDRVSAHAERDAQAAHTRNDWGYALAIFEAVSQQIPPARTSFAHKASATREAWSQNLQAGAQQAEDDALAGLALLYWGKAFALSGDPSARQRFLALRQQVRAGLAYRAHVDGERTSQAFPAIAAALASPRASTLHIETRKPEPGDKFDARLNFTVSAPTFETRERTRLDSLTYQSGTRMVKNYDYDHAQADLTDEERQLVAYQRDLSRAQAQLERDRNAVARQQPSESKSYADYALERAQSAADRARENVDAQRDRVQHARERLAATEAYVEEPVYRTLQYAVTTHFRSATSILAIRLESSDEGAALDKTYTLYAEHADETHQAYPEAGLSADPLLLASESDLRAQLFADAVGPITQALEERFQRWRDMTLTQGLEAASDRERIDRYVRYILSDPNAVGRDVGTALPNLSGIPDAIEILSQ